MNIDISNDEFEEVYKDILFHYIESKSIQKSISPTAIILGGQPGAGKSFLVREVEKEFQNDFIFISTDDLRLYHPLYIKIQSDPQTVQNAANLVNPYASAWTERLIKHCIEHQFNIIIDSTLGGNTKAVFETIDLLRKNNFAFHIRVMAVPAVISQLSIFLRYESQLKEKGVARWTRMDDHDDRFEKIPVVLEQLLSNKPPDSIRFFKRIFHENTTISLSNLPLYTSFSNSTFFEDFNQAREKLSASDLRFINKNIEIINSLIQNRKGDDTEFRLFLQSKKFLLAQ